MNDLTPHPLEALTDLEIVASAMKPCHHCSSTSQIVPSQAPPGIGVYRLALETTHLPGCPDHEDFWDDID